LQQVTGRPRDVRRGQRVLDAERLPRVDLEVVLKLGRHQPRFENANLHAGPGQFYAEGLGQRLDGVLGPRVHADRVAHLGAEDAGDVDQVAAVLPFEVTQGGV